MEALVVDARGRPAAGVEAVLAPQGPVSYFGAGYGLTRADDAGRLRWSQLAPGEHTVCEPRRHPWGRAQARFGPESIVVSAEPALQPARWTIDEPFPYAHSLTGVVVDADALPVEGARVEILDANGALLGTCIATAQDGRFRVDGLSKGPYRVVAELEPGGRVEIGPVDASAHSVSIALPRSAEIDVVVRDARTGHPIPRFSIGGRGQRERGARWRWPPLIESRPIRSATGSARIAPVEPGTYWITCGSPGYSGASIRDLSVKAGETTPAVFELERSATIRGRVVDGVTGEPRGGVWVTSAWSDESTWSQATGSDGRFVLRGHGANRYEVVTICAGRATARSGIVELSAGETLELPDLVLLPGGTIEGRVGPAATEGQSANEARATLEIGPIREAWPRGGTLSVASIGADGAFRLDDLEPGRWTLRIHSRKGNSLGNRSPVLFERTVEIHRGETTRVVID